ncbi:hypothetical protein BpHYR1_000183 [Brachionus plicatilis]|uniref:Uncharacterized protein n=1 Tax=Brachionus plicatilis TaxID=10195 RepID=A0A3M7R4B0_BRAPC|nr:hypothetical protein BpHYR1_000183 [Brachionus plicatilis]
MKIFPRTKTNNRYSGWIRVRGKALAEKVYDIIEFIVILVRCKVLCLIDIDFDIPFSLIGLCQQQAIPSSLGMNQELHTLLAERYEAEISNTSGNLTTKKADN